MRKSLVLIVALTAAFLSGCAAIQGSQLRRSIEAHRRESALVELGMSRRDVMEILEHTQDSLPSNTRRVPESFYDANGQPVEIVFFRSGWVSDGRSTDDEFTPYVFRDGILVSIGWTALGGPRTTAGRGERTGMTVGPARPPSRTPGSSVACRDAIARGDEGAMLAHCD